MKDKTVVITGGAGFIGSNLAAALCKQNDVVVVDDLSTGHRHNIQHLLDDECITFIQGSITSLDLLQKIFRGIDYVFHQAAIPSVPRSVKDPITTTNVSINGTLNVLLAARDCGVSKVVYASSSSVYGDTPTLPKKEEMNPCPLSPYAIGKLTAEYYSQVFTSLYDLSTVCLRYFNVYGPHQDPLSEYAAVIPKFITALSNDKSPVVYGDGNQTRDFTYVSDVVHANILAAEGDATGVFNIAGGNRISINQLVESLNMIIGKQITPVYEDPRAGDILHSLADISQAQNHIGFFPEFSLEQGLKETVEWFQAKK